MADFNLDDLPDLVVVNRNHQAQIFRSVTKGAGRWLDLALIAQGANTNAIGAWVEVKAGDLMMTREITVRGAHASGQQTWIHLGLAAMTDANGAGHLARWHQECRHARQGRWLLHSVTEPAVEALGSPAVEG